MSNKGRHCIQSLSHIAHGSRPLCTRRSSGDGGCFLDEKQGAEQKIIFSSF